MAALSCWRITLSAFMQLHHQLEVVLLVLSSLYKTVAQLIQVSKNVYFCSNSMYGWDFRSVGILVAGTAICMCRNTKACEELNRTAEVDKKKHCKAEVICLERGKKFLILLILYIFNGKLTALCCGMDTQAHNNQTEFSGNNSL